jgi:hypothetical protein|tara:strand:- start:2342 stop:2821 length:480 start_codon:yes stop_codon:yes gene_type:complete
MTKRFSENLSPTYKRRNRALISLFEKAEMKVSLLGDLRKPNMIHEDTDGNVFQLAIYVKNFDIYVKENLYDQDHFAIFSLDDSEDKLAEFIELMESSNQEKVYRIVYGELYYSGLKRDYSSGENYPVFSKQFPKIYYTTDKAIEESYSLRMLGYKTEFE